DLIYKQALANISPAKPTGALRLCPGGGFVERFVLPQGALNIMVQRLHVSVALLACAVLALATPGANADGKKKDKDRPRLSGTWARQEGEMKIEFSDKDVMKIVPHGEKKVIVVVC